MALLRDVLFDAAIADFASVFQHGLHLTIIFWLQDAIKKNVIGRNCLLFKRKIEEMYTLLFIINLYFN